MPGAHVLCSSVIRARASIITSNSVSKTLCVHNDQTGDTILCSYIAGNSELGGDTVEDIRGLKPRPWLLRTFLVGWCFVKR